MTYPGPDKPWTVWWPGKGQVFNYRTRAEAQRAIETLPPGPSPAQLYLLNIETGGLIEQAVRPVKRWPRRMMR